jgi:hypothetical protein
MRGGIFSSLSAQAGACKLRSKQAAVCAFAIRFKPVASGRLSNTVGTKMSVIFTSSNTVKQKRPSVTDKRSAKGVVKRASNGVSGDGVSARLRAKAELGEGVAPPAEAHERKARLFGRGKHLSELDVQCLKREGLPSVMRMKRERARIAVVIVCLHCFCAVQHCSVTHESWRLPAASCACPERQPAPRHSAALTAQHNQGKERLLSCN